MKLFEVLKPLLENKADWAKQNLGKKLLDAALDDQSVITGPVSNFSTTYKGASRDTSGDKYRDEDGPPIPPEKNPMVSWVIDYFTEIDPTPNNKYLVWIANRYVENNFKLREDDEALHDLLKHFHDFKKYLDKKDINQYKSMAELHDAISGFLENVPNDEYDAHLRRSGQVKVHIDNERILLVTPLTEEASKFYAEGTTWCTQYKNHFESYSRDGPLYYLLDKNSGEKYNLHFASQEFQDAGQHGIYVGEVLEEYGLFEFFEKNGDIDDLIKNTPEITKEGDQYYLIIDDLVDLAKYIDTSGIRQSFVEELLSGDAFSSFEINSGDMPEEIFIVDNSDNEKEYMNKTMELLMSALKAIFGEEVGDYFDKHDLVHEERIFSRLKEIIDEEYIPEDIPESLNTLKKYIEKSEELKDAMFYAYINAKEQASENEALNDVFKVLREVGINVDEIQWESSEKDKREYQRFVGKIPLEKAVAYQIILEEDDELSIKLEQPYMGWNGDVTYDQYWDILSNKLHDTSFSEKIGK